LPQLLLHSDVSGREVKDGHLFHLCRPRQMTGLPGREVVLSLGNLPVSLQKYSFNKQVVGSLDQGHYSLAIGLAVRHIGYVAYFLTRCDPGNFIGKRPYGKMLCRLLPIEFYFKFRRGISLTV
jgi:hypothetical protein